MNERLLRAKLVEKDLSVDDLAEVIGKNRATLYRKLKSDTLSNKEANAISKYLQLNHSEIMNIFFDDTVAYYASNGIQL